MSASSESPDDGEGRAIKQARELASAVYKSILDRQGDRDGVQYYSSLLYRGEMTAREMVRRLCKSDEFVDKFLLKLPLDEVCHGVIFRLLGRPAKDHDEAKELASRILSDGWPAQVDFLLNNGEYIAKFGDGRPPTITVERPPGGAKGPPSMS